MQSEEQPIGLGPCVYCGSDCYTLPSGKFWSSDPAPDCLCCVEGEDEAEDRENLIRANIKDQDRDDAEKRERMRLKRGKTY